MEIKQKASELIEKYTKIQGDLYHQIERVEHSINLLKLRNQENLIDRGFNKAKIQQAVFDLNDYKSLLSAHANFIDIKLSVLTKESQKPTATLQSLESINKASYDGETNIAMPKELAETLNKFGIKFDKNDVVNLKVDSIVNPYENEYVM